MAESRRNPEIARVYQDVERDIKASLVAMLQKAADDGEIRREIDLTSAATVLLVLADGISWRRAVDPHFDAEKLLPMVLQMVACLLGKSQADGQETTP